jgi:hypothetical protein
LQVSIQPCAQGEAWHRNFAGSPLSSRLRAHSGLLEERLGPASLRFALESRGGAIEWRLVAVRILGIGFPRAWCDVAAREFEASGEYRFDVRVSLAWAGPLVHYSGMLDVTTAE